MAADFSTPFFPAESAHPARPPPRKPRPLTPESKYWRSFRSSELATGLVLPVTSLCFSPAPPHPLAFSSSASLHLYDPLSFSPASKSPLTSFPDLAFSPSFRCDGALLAAGCASGAVHIFAASDPGRALRLLRAHARPVRLVRYPRLADKLHLLSAGDDALVSLWDVSAETPLVSVPAAHRDYIRAGSASPVAPDVFATGSYDHCVKIWDLRLSQRAGSAVCSLDHGDPVESALFLPSGGLLATAGGNKIKLWDIIGGGRPIHTIESHNKTVTDLSLGRFGDNAIHGGAESRLLSVSIDGHLKVFDYASFKITHSMRFPAQLLSVAFSPLSSAWVVGTSNGVVYLGKKKEKKEVVAHRAVDEFEGFNVEPEKKVLGPTNFRYFHRSQSEKPSEGDYVVKRTVKVKLAEHDRLLKKFQHREALVSVLNSKNPNSVVAVMEELVARRKLLKCVANLDSDELALLLSFLHRFATMPQNARFLMRLAKKVLEMRAEDVGSSDKLRCHVRNLKTMVAEEIKVQNSLQEIQGMISPLLVIAGR